MAGQFSLPIQTYLHPDNTPVANGYLRVRLNKSGSLAIGGPVVYHQVENNFVTVPLDSNGVISGSPLFWANSLMTPSDTYYIIEVYTRQGQYVALYTTTIED